MKICFTQRRGSEIDQVLPTRPQPHENSRGTSRQSKTRGTFPRTRWRRNRAETPVLNDGKLSHMLTLAGTFHQTSVTRKCINSLYVTIKLQEKYSHQISVRGKRRSSRETRAELLIKTYRKSGGILLIKTYRKTRTRILLIKTRWQKKPEERLPLGC